MGTVVVPRGRNWFEDTEGNFWGYGSFVSFTEELTGDTSSKLKVGASLVVQWLRIRPPMQETRVQALVQEDPTCRGATKPVRHSYWACALEPASHNYWARAPQLLKPARLEPVLPTREATTMRSLRSTMKSSPRLPQAEKSLHAATKTQCSQK